MRNELRDDYKSRLVNRRACSVGFVRREMGRRGYQIHQLVDSEGQYSFCGYAPLALLKMAQSVSANFAPHFAPSPAFVAQWIEQRFPKPQVAGPIPAEGASRFLG